MKYQASNTTSLVITSSLLSGGHLKFKIVAIVPHLRALIMTHSLCKNSKIINIIDLYPAVKVWKQDNTALTW